MFAALLLAAAPALLAASPLPSSPASPGRSAPSETARYRVALQTPAGDLPFLVEFQGEQAFVVNGSERIPVPSALRTSNGFTLEFPHYDSKLTASASEGDSTRLEGRWTKVRGADRVAQVELTATPLGEPDFAARFEPLSAATGTPPSAKTADLPQRWSMRFESSDTPAVGVFETGAGDGSNGRTVTGTVLTHVGDYRFLAGRLDGDRLRLSCFDGAHAFLFDATLDANGQLAGTFQSGDWWSEPFEATPDPSATLPDPFQQVRALPGSSLFHLSGLDAEGAEQRLVDLGLAGKPLVVQVFGSWCPNCHDEAAYLAKLAPRFAERGVGFLGLAFELTGDAARDLEQVTRFAARYGIEYPLLLMGTADKRGAAETLGLLDAVLSFPTTLFVDAAGEIRGVHSGFSGPATGTDHELLTAEFERRIEALIAEPGDLRGGVPMGVAEWNEWGGEGRGVRFSSVTGKLSAALVRDPEEEGTETVVTRTGPVLTLANRTYVLDPVSRAFLDPTDASQRLTPRGETRAPTVWSWGESPDEILTRSEARDPRATRELVLALVPQLAAAGEAGATALQRGMTSEVPWVRAATAWALGEAHAQGLGSLLLEPGVVEAHGSWIVEQMGSRYAPLQREAVRALDRFELIRVADAAQADLQRRELARSHFLPSVREAMRPADPKREE